MEITKQLSVFMENMPGNLAKFCSILEESKIDILGITVTDAVDHAVIRLVVKDTKKCTHVLGDHGIMVIESDILKIKLAHQPGELKKIAQALSQEQMNIDYIYGSESGATEKATLFLKTSDTKKAYDLINKYLAG